MTFLKWWNPITEYEAFPNILEWFFFYEDDCFSWEVIILGFHFVQK